MKSRRAWVFLRAGTGEYGQRHKKPKRLGPKGLKGRACAKGFSLLELLAVIFILVIMAAVVVPKYRQYNIQSQINSVKPSLSYIYNLFKLHYIDKGAFKDLAISNVQPPKGYCVTVAIQAGASKQPSPNFIGDCNSAGANKIFRPGSATEEAEIQEPDSGFVIIAYGTDFYLDVGMNHKGQIMERGADKSGSGVFDLLTKGVGLCKDYTDRKDCQTAGCYWDLIAKTCDDS